jgi:hypothetical protein
MRVAGCMRLALLFGGALLLNAQEVRYVDLTAVTQRTALRHPPAPPINCNDGSTCGVGAGHSGVSVSDGAPDIRDPHALGIYFLSPFPAEINAVEQFEVEFKVLNTGLAPIELPVSPHLSDLQESDVSPFTYTSLALVVRVRGEHPACVPCLAYVELYGARNRDESTVVLKPGEWIRVKGTTKFQQGLTGVAELSAEFWLRTNTFTPDEGGGFTQINNVSPNVTPTPRVTVHFSPDH